MRLRGARSSHLDLGVRDAVTIGPVPAEIGLEAVLAVEPGELVIVGLDPRAARRGILLPAGTLFVPPTERPARLSLVLAALEPMTVAPGDPLARMVVVPAPLENLRHDPVLTDELDDALPAMLVDSLLVDDPDNFFGAFRPLSGEEAES